MPTTHQPYQRTMHSDLGHRSSCGDGGAEMAPDPSSHETIFVDICASMLDRLFAHIDGLR